MNKFSRMKKSGEKPQRGLLRRKLAVLLIFVLLLSPANVRAASKQYRMNIAVSVNGADAGSIPAFDEEYENNLYISLQGLAYALRGTEKAFTAAVEKNKIEVTTGMDASLPPSVWSDEELESVGTGASARYELYVDGAERKYYSCILADEEGYDAFMEPVSLAMMLDLDMEVSEDRIEIDTSVPFSVTAEEMEEAGYLQSVNALVIGDGTTGEIFYAYQENEPVYIASTTKLMTYLVFMDAASQGNCSLKDTVVISEKAAKLSKGSDGVIPMEAGSRIPVQELLYGMLLPSSNECALAIAEHVSGSEEAFVELMNEKAEELGLKNARFYNCNGLPIYEDQVIPAKMQNYMTAEEMFQLASHILETYPQITDFTSVREYHSDVFNKDLKNTNAVLYNMENMVGLKTGTTNKAGACLVTCVAAEKDGQTHHLITALFGAEGDAARGITSELSARYAMTALQESTGSTVTEEGHVIPTDPEKVVQRLLRRMKLV